MVDSRLTVSDHVSKSVGACSSSMFALRLLRTHGLKREELHLVASATIPSGQSCIRYPRVVGVCGRRGPSPPGSAIVTRMRRMGYLPPDFPSFETLADEADRKLLKSISEWQTYVLRHLLTDKPISTRPLRVMAHNFILPPKGNRNFVSMVLYNVVCPNTG